MSSHTTPTKTRSILSNKKKNVYQCKIKLIFMSFSCFTHLYLLVHDTLDTSSIKALRDKSAPSMNTTEQTNMIDEAFEKGTNVENDSDNDIDDDDDEGSSFEYSDSDMDDMDEMYIKTTKRTTRRLRQQNKTPTLSLEQQLALFDVDRQSARKRGGGTHEDATIEDQVDTINSNDNSPVQHQHKKRKLRSIKSNFVDFTSNTMDDIDEDLDMEYTSNNNTLRNSPYQSTVVLGSPSKLKTTCSDQSRRPFSPESPVPGINPFTESTNHLSTKMTILDQSDQSHPMSPTPTSPPENSKRKRNVTNVLEKLRQQIDDHELDLSQHSFIPASFNNTSKTFEQSYPTMATIKKEDDMDDSTSINDMDYGYDFGSISETNITSTNDTTTSMISNSYDKLDDTSTKSLLDKEHQDLTKKECSDMINGDKHVDDNKDTELQQDNAQPMGLFRRVFSFIFG
ncbi:uncharacterized protein BX664DRAFT_343259 [Halteromyces radiatus]|uniref:uncharacterized protein n=1 Tax=Halteromyces radiatus TaxID=101107 RepID=UPI0022201DD6|nr:uncharacterized protein BX664DRAFT_343259 [Halteromyces radiatus]KAI8077698.1 hypothetical protein BX664DRAFT_343259 [Halteromyces radiatus]